MVGFSQREENLSIICTEEHKIIAVIFFFMNILQMTYKLVMSQQERNLSFYLRAEEELNAPVQIQAIHLVVTNEPYAIYELMVNPFEVKI